MIKVATVFSGIGSFEYALKQMGIDHEIVFACDCGDRKANIDIKTKQDILKVKDNNKRQLLVEKLYSINNKVNRVKQTYFSNYSIQEDKWFTDISFIDGRPYNGKVDIFVGGSPCQSFSLMGKRAGLEDTRGTLFYEFARLVKEIQPKVFIYENVPGMLQHDNGKTWDVIRTVFNSLNYDISYDVLDSSSYGVPQARKRLFVVGFKGKKPRNFSFPKPIKLERYVEFFLEENVNPKYYFKKKGFEFITNPKYSGRAKINAQIIRTEKRNQQFNWNGDFRFEPLDTIKNKEILSTAYVGTYKGVKGVARKLTPRECHRLMGFKDDFVINDNDVDAYKQSGNSIVVDVISRIIESVNQVEKL